MADYTILQGTPIVWADATDFTDVDFTRTAQIDLTSLANGKARQGAKVDLGVNRANRYAVRVAYEADVAPVATSTSVSLYWSASNKTGAGDSNSGGTSGADAAYKDGEELEFLGQLMFLGTIPMTNDAAPTVQKMEVAMFTPPMRYGMPVLLNQSGQAAEGDAIEMYIALVPLGDNIV